MRTKPFDFRGPAGRLEGVWMAPESPPRAVAVLCHAHPLHGGMMHFKLLYRAAKALQGLGVSVLRFNFRGVGRSEGVHDEGRGERDDVRAALDAAAEASPGLPLVLGGFSFGSVMALRVAVDDPRPRSVVALGFPASVLKRTSFVSRVAVPRLFVQGELDEFGDADAIRGVVEPLAEPRDLVVVPGADHFFTGQLDEVARALEQWPELV